MGDWIPDHRCDRSVRDDGGHGFIGFEDNGDVLVSPVAHAASLIKLGVGVTRSLNVGRFSEGQRRYLRFHRESVLLRSKYLEEG
jgi:putative restriction endonuclease